MINYNEELPKMFRRIQTFLTFIFDTIFVAFTSVTMNYQGDGINVRINEYFFE
jgi:hypothetical protein